MGILMNFINIWNPNGNEYFKAFILKQWKCENWSMLPMKNLSQKEKNKTIIKKVVENLFFGPNLRL
jgi:hypothetical protein